jgi:hypothetical protein
MRRTLCAAAVLIAALAAPMRAGDFQPEPGYTSLFNGKDLTGWRYGKDDLAGKTATPDKRIEARDGVIVVNVGKGTTGLYTVSNFDKDFHLKLQFRAAPRADSGVYIRGTQLQVRDYPTVGPYKKLQKFQAGGWNDLDIRVTGQKAVCSCNGEVLEPNFQVPAKGGVGLQAESGKFEFRRVRLMELP